jgi:type II secretory ATPase GspE/PulE/Tfp pilus assembly ATPase PilB-like protein
VTGPTGSGKSTTLYTLASRFPRDSANLLTVEDPVEYLLPFARQIQVSQMLNEKASDVERSVLRQDPDVLIFGEIRDAESARTALKFAESGHLVLATLHAQSSTQAVERLLSMVPDTDRSEAGLVLASTLLTIINQRLVRKLCDCATPLELEQLHALQMDAQSHFQAGFSLPRSLYQAVGCPHCDMSGYRGRVALHETLIFDLSDSERMAMGRHVSQYGTLTGLQDVNGMLVVRRAQVAYQLMECGFVDMATSMTFLAGALGSLESGDL